LYLNALFYKRAFLLLISLLMKIVSINFKFEVMKKSKKQTDNSWVPRIKTTKRKIKVRVNKNLDKYEGVVLFPEKLEQANKMLKGIKLPLPGE